MGKREEVGKEWGGEEVEEERGSYKYIGDALLTILFSLQLHRNDITS